jgi:hypothetical protein
MNGRKIGVYALIVLGLLAGIALVGWGLSSWSTEQAHVGAPEIPTTAVTITPSPTLTPGWWDSPLPVPTQPKK